MTAPGGDHDEAGPIPGHGEWTPPLEYPADYPGALPPYPPPGYGPPYPGNYPHPGYAPPGRNPLAVISLICSLAGVFCCVGSIAGIVLGMTALEQIKRNRQEGYGLAVAGIVVGVAALVVNLVVVIFAINSR
jgi:hypothetical protein